MAHIHITLVGGQPTPVYQGVVLSQPDKIILVCSAGEHGTEKLALSIQEKLHELHFFSVMIEKIVTNNVHVITQKLGLIFSTITSDDTLSINVSGGVRIWSVLCYKLCPFHTAHIYCISQNGEVLTLQGECNSERVKFDIFTQFILLGNPLEHYNSFADYSDEERNNHDIISKYYSNDSFRKKLKLFQKKYAEDNSFLDNDQEVGNETHYIYWFSTDRVFQIGWGEQIEEITGKFAIPMLLNTAWYEYEIASILAQIYGPENVYTNCVFKLKDSNEDKNEVDIIVNTGQKLLFVECKTRIDKITDIDKFHSVVKNYGGNGSKALFVTMQPIDQIRQEKCKDNHINHCFTHQQNKKQINPQQLKQVIQEFIDFQNY